jgi:hypothetical protein
VNLAAESLRGLYRLGKAGFVDVTDRDLCARLGKAVREMTPKALGTARHDDLQIF